MSHDVVGNVKTMWEVNYFFLVFLDWYLLGLTCPPRTEVLIEKSIKKICRR